MENNIKKPIITASDLVLPSRVETLGRYTLEFRVESIAKLYGMNGWKLTLEGSITVNKGKKSEKVLYSGTWTDGYFNGKIRHNYWCDIYEAFWQTCQRLREDVLDQVHALNGTWNGGHTGDFR